MDGTVIVADDDRTIRTVLTQALTRAGCKVRSTGSVNTLWRWVEEGEGDVVISDVNFPDGDGLEVLPSIRRKRNGLPVIVISAQNTVMTAIKASEKGAYEYLPKPFDLKELLSVVSKALSSNAQQTLLNSEDGSNDDGLPLVGAAPLMQEIYRILARVIQTDLSIMITGESGTGKDLLARTIHQLGPRAAEDFITINASSSSVEHLEAILAGSGAQSDMTSQARARSTIYLDEIGEMGAVNQLRLLDLLRSPLVQERGYRFISSTRQTLDDLVHQGMFREDLFYRLNVVAMAMPPLRDRLSDIGALANHFLVQFATEGMPQRTVSPKVIDMLKAQYWKGNVRELKNFLNRLVLLSTDEEISEKLVEETLAQLPKDHARQEIATGESLSSLVEVHVQRYFDLHGSELPPVGLYHRILREVELPLIAISLAATRGNQIKTAELLGINRNTLRKKIKELEIQVTRSRKMM